MTDRLTALEELKAKVEAGECPIYGRADPCGLGQGRMHLKSAVDGSVDAAMTMKDATLPGFMWMAGWEVASSRHRYIVWREHEDDEKWITGTASNECPARALVLANLSALIELEKADD